MAAVCLAQYCDDSPAEAMLDAHRVQEGDLIVLASDGLWDNLIASEWQYSFLSVKNKHKLASGCFHAESSSGLNSL